jgi:RNA polymerase sigma-70 factor (ECF subfamily)
MSDQEAIQRLKNGDISGLESLIASYQLKAVRTAYFVVQDEQTAEDIVQDIFVQLYERICYFDETRPFGPYLMRSVVNLAINVAQKRQRFEPQQNNGDLGTLENLLSRAESVEGQIEIAEIKHNILAAIAKLPARERAVVVQRYYLEMSEKEMAVSLDAAPGTVKWLLNAARTRLRGLLKAERSEK